MSTLLIIGGGAMAFVWTLVLLDCLGRRQERRRREHGDQSSHARAHS